jgi:hypothetical protein
MVHLADDVMISLRAGQLLMETGTPSFNRTDLSQPSTSYLAPYLFAGLSCLLATSTAVIAYAVLGLLAGGATLAAIAFRSTSPALALASVVALASTRTNMIYTLNGWDHLFQAFFLTTAALIVLRNKLAGSDMFKVSLAVTLGSLFRPDGLFITIGIIAAAYFSADRKRTFFLYCLMPTIVLAVLFLLANWLQFSFLTPTTARLKIGAAPSLDYILKYVSRNSISSFTAATVAIASLAIYATFRRKLYDNKHFWIICTSVLTCLLSTYNSDVFIGARMFWTPACVMVATICITDPAGTENLAGSLRRLTPTFHAIIGKILKRTTILKYHFSYISSPKSLMLIGGLSAIALIALPKILLRYEESIIRIDRGNLPVTFKQLLIADWIANNLSPSNGAIGLFYLGIGFHLSAFEVADFLGKADEMIATKPIRWGAPGHNKWDIDATLHKWAPQAIISGSRDFPRTESEIKTARAMITERRDYAFLQDFVLNERLARDYVRCYILTLPYGVKDEWGILMKRSIVGKLSSHLACIEPARLNDMGSHGN